MANINQEPWINDINSLIEDNKLPKESLADFNRFISSIEEYLSTNPDDADSLLQGWIENAKEDFYVEEMKKTPFYKREEKIYAQMSEES